MNLRLEVDYNREKLIGVIRKNRRNHAQQFNKNVAIYREKQREWLKDQLKKLDGPRPRIERQMSFPAPQHYIKNYDQALSMLEACDDEKIHLDHQTFSTLVSDDWEGQGINQYPLCINTPLDSGYGRGAEENIDLLEE